MQKLRLGGSFNRVFQNMEGYTTCSITGFRTHKYEYNTLDGKPTFQALPGKENIRDLATHTDNQLRNRILEEQIRKAGLGYSKCIGNYLEEGQESASPEESFIIYNTKYRTSDFINLMVYLGSKFDQDTVLITNPTYKKDGRTFANVEANLYATSPRVGVLGSVVEHFDKVSTLEIKDYFTKIFGRNYTFSKVSHIEEPHGHISGINTKRLFDLEFEKLFPEVAKQRRGFKKGERHWN